MPNILDWDHVEDCWRPVWWLCMEPVWPADPSSKLPLRWDGEPVPHFCHPNFAGMNRLTMVACYTSFFSLSWMETHWVFVSVRSFYLLDVSTSFQQAGDRSLADVVAHEISHSWTGNLVTNKQWEHFWLNEGFTMFVERKIAGRMHGEATRNFSAIGGWKDLRDCVSWC